MATLEEYVDLSELFFCNYRVPVARLDYRKRCTGGVYPMCWADKRRRSCADTDAGACASIFLLQSDTGHGELWIRPFTPWRRAGTDANPAESAQRFSSLSSLCIFFSNAKEKPIRTMVFWQVKSI